MLAGIELLKEVSGDERAEARRSDIQRYEQMDLFETMDSVMHGETPIRRWKAAASGKVSKTGGKAAADYTAIAIRTVKSLPGVWQHWQEVPMDVRGPIIAEFRAALEWLPEDFRAVIAEELGGSPGTARPTKGKRR